MKKCPQCNSVFEDETAYCPNDGAALIEEHFSLPSNDSIEAETLVRSEPIIIDLANINEPPPIYPVQPAEQVVIVPAIPPPTRNYALFLILGLLIGGGLVLATLLVSRNLNQPENSNVVKTNANVVSTVKPKPTLEIQNKNENISVEINSNKHAEPNDNADGNTNGRVIVLNARVRSAPSKDSPIVDTLPMNDRLDIIRREDANSPWYQVECEHGTSGWMHGNTIEFTK
jgi:hypothetical protein